MKRLLVLVGVVAMACSRHPLEKDDGGNAGTSGGGIAGAGRGAAGAGNGGSAVAGAGGVAGVGAAGAGSGIGGAASGGIGGTASGGTGAYPGVGIGGIGGTASGGIGGTANGGASGGIGGAANGGASGIAGSSAGCGGGAGALGACKLQVGQPCVLNAQCATALCADGVCCESACAGPCVSCNQPGLAGRCSAVVLGVPDPHGVCVATSPATCGLDGRCDGSGACRKYYVSTVCAAETCSGGIYSPLRICDGAGTCLPPTYMSCAPYTCITGANRCGLSCTDDPQCTSGAVCRNGVCQRPADPPPCVSTSCPSGICAQGVCCATACQGPCNSCALPGTAGICAPVSNPDPSWNCPAGNKQPGAALRGRRRVRQRPVRRRRLLRRVRVSVPAAAATWPLPLAGACRWRQARRIRVVSASPVARDVRAGWDMRRIGRLPQMGRRHPLRGGDVQRRRLHGPERVQRRRHLRGAGAGLLLPLQVRPEKLPLILHGRSGVHDSACARTVCAGVRVGGRPA